MLLLKIISAIIFALNAVFTSGNFAQVNCKLPPWNYVSAVVNVITVGIAAVSYKAFDYVIKKLQKEIDRMSEENEKFKVNNERLDRENNEFAESNKRLRGEVKSFDLNNKKLLGEVRRLADENKEFETNNGIFIERLNELDLANRRLAEANKKLIAIQNQSQDLLNSLMSAGDQFTDFGSILAGAVEKNLSLADKLEILVQGMSVETFRRLDKNGDGILTLDEIQN